MVHLSASWTAEGRGAAIMDSVCLFGGINRIIISTLTKKFFVK